jgi:hypothetical protein
MIYWYRRLLGLRCEVAKSYRQFFKLQSGASILHQNFSFSTSTLALSPEYSVGQATSFSFLKPSSTDGIFR